MSRLPTDEEMEARFGEHQEPDTIEDVLNRINDLEAQIEAKTDRIYYAMFPLAVVLLIILYKVS